MSPTVKYPDMSRDDWLFLYIPELLHNIAHTCVAFATLSIPPVVVPSEQCGFVDSSITSTLFEACSSVFWSNTDRVRADVGIIAVCVYFGNTPNLDFKGILTLTQYEDLGMHNWIRIREILKCFLVPFRIKWCQRLKMCLFDISMILKPRSPVDINASGQTASHYSP